MNMPHAFVNWEVSRCVIKRTFHEEGCQHSKQVRGRKHRLLTSGLSDERCCQETDEYEQQLLEPMNCRNDHLLRGSGTVDCFVNSLRPFLFSSWELHTHLYICPHICPCKGPHGCVGGMLCFGLQVSSLLLQPVLPQK